jgi:hypothetical protein
MVNFAFQNIHIQLFNVVDTFMELLEEEIDNVLSSHMNILKIKELLGMCLECLETLITKVCSQLDH